jgi:UDP-glucose:glycoprotein glucosyltransferase
LYNKFLKLLQSDGHLKTPEAISSFQFALSIHSAAPRIEAHYQFYNSSVVPLLGGSDCIAWVSHNGQQYCSPGKTEASLEAADILELPFDRMIGTPTAAGLHVLYADIADPAFREHHKYLSKRVKKDSPPGSEAYAVRYKPPKDSASKPLNVHGYGVELALKRTDYIVIDDRDKEESQQKVDSKSAEKSIEAEEDVADLKPLSASEVTNLGLNAGSYIRESKNPLDTLLKVAQDFPKYSSLISAKEASDSFVMEHSHNNLVGLPAGYNVFWINGQQIDPRKLDAFYLLDHLRRERQYIQGVMDLGFTGLQGISLLSHEAIAEKQDGDEAQRYDWRDDQEGGKIIMWLNNIEKDKRYEEWPTTVMGLLQRTFPGQMPTIRKELHNCIFPINFASSDSVAMVLEHFITFVQRKIPIRFGLLPFTETPGATAQAKVVYHLLDTYGLAALVEYLESSHEAKKLESPNQAIFDKVCEGKTARNEKVERTLQEVLEAEELLPQIEGAKSYLSRLAFSSEEPFFLVNGLPLDLGDSWLQKLSSQISVDLRTVQQAVVEEEVGDEDWLPNVWLEHASPRRNPILIPEDSKSLKFADLSQIYDTYADAMGELPHIPATKDKKEGEEWSHMIVVGDFESAAGSQLLHEILKFRALYPLLDVTLLSNANPSRQGGEAIQPIADLLNAKSAADQTQELAKLGFSPEEQKALEKPFLAKLRGSAPDLRDMITQELKLEAGEHAIVFNGRIVGPFPETAQALTAGDLGHLMGFELNKRVQPALTALKDLDLLSKVSSPLALAKISSMIARSMISDVPEGIFADFPTQRMSMWEKWDDEYTAIEVGDKAKATIQIVVCLDPASENAQKWTPLLKVLSELSGVYLKIYLNPKNKLDELPVKRFYRYVLSSKPSFNKDGSMTGSRAQFRGLPAEALLTMGMDMPAPWLVAPKDSIHDLDNIKLSQLKSGADIEATYELENILIEGHSRDLTTGRTPRGVQLMLGTQLNPREADTIVMANLGYFQFKANPGYYKIQLLPGRSEEIFNIESLGTKGYSPTPGDENTEIALMSFQGVTLFPRVSRKPGMEEVDVLAADKTPLEDLAEKGTDMAQNVLGDQAADLVSKGFKFGTSLLNKAGLGAQRPPSRHADINIFSVASGHLYERMLNIMMVSVMKHTQHTVKFWFIEQFLSPSFKQFLPQLAAEYGFEFEMVTYKWPHWLRGQKEKQREIWGYKILFLDVLFPQDLDRVIFVDADQIVRTDMYELTTFDLDGAPYGFTPMCDSRTEMEGFRFWKQGYWQKALRGRPYHISALYVVDLKRFRQLAAGDRLRQQYHSLSADPNSLSNLDQDLPNNMQFQLPIFSLPQHWLWCETWCSDEALREAKTIDLCNNPQTKEPKLDRARRQVPEWTVYDEEIATLAKRVGGTVADEAAHVVAGDSKDPTADTEDAEKKEHVRDEL